MGLRVPPMSMGVLSHVNRRSRQDPKAIVQATSLGDAGARFLLTVPEDLPMRPVRAYASLTSASTPALRVEQVMRELERQGAFTRKFIFVGAATGGGHVNPVALELVERMAGGDIASAAIQYGTRPSIFSIDKVDEASDLLRLLLARIRSKLRQLYPNGGGPRVLLYGESLGGWASQNALSKSSDIAAGKDPLVSLGVDRVALIGVPGMSRFDRSSVGTGGYQAIAAISELKDNRLSEKNARIWELSHRDDPVHRADLRMVWKRPSWLPKDGNNPIGVGADERWTPLGTFIDTLKTALLSVDSEEPGKWRAQQHDYRKELPRFLRSAFGFSNISDTELARIAEQARQSEVWINAQEWS